MMESLIIYCYRSSYIMTVRLPAEGRSAITMTILQLSPTACHHHCSSCTNTHHDHCPSYKREHILHLTIAAQNVSFGIKKKPMRSLVKCVYKRKRVYGSSQAETNDVLNRRSYDGCTLYAVQWRYIQNNIIATSCIYIYACMVVRDGVFVTHVCLKSFF